MAEKCLLCQGELRIHNGDQDICSYRPFYQYGGSLWILLFQIVIMGSSGGKLVGMYLPPEHPMIDIWNNTIQNGHCIGKKVCCLYPRELAKLSVQGKNSKQANLTARLYGPYLKKLYQFLLHTF